MTATLTYITDSSQQDFSHRDFGRSDCAHHAAPTVDRRMQESTRLDPEIYRARRVAALAVAFAVLVIAVVGFTSVASQAAASRGSVAGAGESVSITVRAGDTLWGIARQLAPDADPRPLVAELSVIAGDASIQPGQELVVPAGLLG